VTAPKEWKTCSKCHKKKPITEFSRGGKRPECKECNALYQRLLRAEGRIKNYPRAKDKYEVLRDGALNPYSQETPECFKNFVDAFWPDEPLPDHAVEWVEAALTHRRLLLNVPPGHAKTSVMAVRFTLWQLALDRNKNILIVSKTTKLGEKIARALAQEMEHNDRLNMAFGRFKAPEGNRWSVGLGELMVDGKDPGTGDLSVLIRGWSQQTLGFRADQIIADDPTDRGIATSELERDKQRDWFVGEIETRLKPDGRIFCIGQRVHVDDLYGWLAQKYNEDTQEYVWTQIETPAVLDWDKKEMLWPEHWSWDRIQEMRWSMGDGDFNCYYQQNPAAGGHFFKEWWFAGNGTPEYPGCFDYERRVGQGWKLPEGQQIPVTRVVAIDPSPTQYCGMVVADVIYQGVLGMEFWAAIVDIRRDRMGQRDMIAHLTDLWSEYHPQAVVFEQNSVKWLHEDPEWNRVTSMFQTVIPHNTGQNKNSEEMGVWSLASDVQSGRIRFPAASPEDVDLSNLLISEMLAYPRQNKTSDVLMAMWLIKFNYKHLIPSDAYDDLMSNRRRWNMRKKAERGAWSKEFVNG
jgi:hypothetical protein